ncbi:50S ribosomal protein L27 [Candidatus Microgenomates bacterium]|nr:50S ribosomal protein L27 [Candidatus Microgenomates bacterium]
MAHKKALGSAKKNKDSIAKRLGVKIYGGQKAQAGSIIVRQRGTRYVAGANTMMGKDHTIFATIPGIVHFITKKKTGYNSLEKIIKSISIIADKK